MLKQEDQFFIDKVLAGDTSAFAVLVERHKNNVFNICIKVLHNREDSEEVAQDTFLKVFEKLKTFRKEAKFSTWIFRIAYNMSISRQRKNKTKQLDIKDYMSETSSEEEMIERLNLESTEEREMLLRSAIAKLEGTQQLLLQLYYDKDLSTIEMAKITNLSESNVRVKMHRARKILFSLMATMPETTKNSIA